MKHHIIYISGPMSGYKDFNYPAFRKAHADLTRAGFNVVSPAKDHLLSPGITYEQCMNEAMELLKTANIIALLPGFEHSAGAQKELAYARENNYGVFLISQLLSGHASFEKYKSHVQ